MEEDKKEIETVGAASQRLLSKADTKQGIIDTQKEMQKRFLEEISICTQRKEYEDWKDPWYVIVLSRRERTMINVIRNQFFGRKSLPRPEFDQNVFKYYPLTGNLEYIWTIPDRDTTYWLATNPETAPTEQKQLVNFCVEFINGTLYNRFFEKPK
ncbi:MAG: hypothetical protein ACE5RC_00060 [Nitrosopumilus sp.]